MDKDDKIATKFVDRYKNDPLLVSRSRSDQYDNADEAVHGIESHRKSATGQFSIFVFTSRPRLRMTTDPFDSNASSTAIEWGTVRYR